MDINFEHVDGPGGGLVQGGDETHKRPVPDRICRWDKGSRVTEEKPGVTGRIRVTLAVGFRVGGGHLVWPLHWERPTFSLRVNPYGHLRPWMVGSWV